MKPNIFLSRVQPLVEECSVAVDRVTHPAAGHGSRPNLDCDSQTKHALDDNDLPGLCI